MSTHSTLVFFFFLIHKWLTIQMGIKKKILDCQLCSECNIFYLQNYFCLEFNIFYLHYESDDIKKYLKYSSLYLFGLF